MSRPRVWAVAVALFDGMRREGGLQAQSSAKSLVPTRASRTELRSRPARNDLHGRVGILHTGTLDRRDLDTAYETEPCLTRPIGCWRGPVRRNHSDQHPVRDRHVGISVTEEDISRWADEAKQGCRINELPRRGRPSLGEGSLPRCVVRLDRSSQLRSTIGPSQNTPPLGPSPSAQSSVPG